MSININEVLNELQETINGDILIVNADDRTIETTNLILGVAGDENANRVYFLCPKVVSNDIDLTTLYIFINYVNANKEQGQYLVEDVQVVKEDYILFSWETTKFVTAKNGKTKFQVCAKKTIDDEMNHWNTTYTSGRVLKGLETTNDLVEQNVDVIDQILTRLKGVEENTDSLTNDHDDLINVPTKLSQFENDLNLDIPTKLSDLEIDMEVGGASSWNDLKDKPFTKEFSEEGVVLLDNKTFTFRASTQDVQMVTLGVNDGEDNSAVALQEGYKYLITINGVEHTGIVKKALVVDDYFDMTTFVLGNPAINPSVLEQGFEPTDDTYLLMYAINRHGEYVVYASVLYTTDLYGETDVAVSITEYAPIDKFEGVIDYSNVLNIPKQTSSWNDLEDRPFYDETKTEVKTITWDGNTDGLESVQGLYFKVSDEVAENIDIYKTGTLTIYDSSDGSYTINIGNPDECGVIEMVENTAYMIGNTIVVVFDEVIVEDEKFTKGLYSSYYNRNNRVRHLSELTYFIEKTELKQLDEKFLPILEETTKFVEVVNDTYAFNSVNVKESLYASEDIDNVNHEMFVAGQNVKVIFDNVEYNLLVSTTTVYDFEVKYFGNGAAITSYLPGAELEDTGDPLCVMIPPDGSSRIGVFTFNEGDEHHIIISLEQPATQIKPEYLPDNIGSSSEPVQPDWDQNDETTPDYIKNRTHWIDVESVETVINIPVTELSYSGGVYMYGYSYDEYPLPLDTTIPIKTTYNSNEYELYVLTEELMDVEYVGDSLVDYMMHGTYNYGFSILPSINNNRLELYFMEEVPNEATLTISYENKKYTELNRLFIDSHLVGLPIAGKTVALPYVEKVDGVNVISTETLINGEGAEIFNTYKGLYTNWAVGAYSHAEGNATKAFGEYSHAEGENTIAFGDTSHAEGGGSEAGGTWSHAEGYYTKANGDYSHTQGKETVANWRSMNVIGEYNEYEHVDKFVEEITQNYNVKIPTKEFLIGDSYRLDKDTGYYTIKDAIITTELVADKYCILNGDISGRSTTLHKILSINTNTSYFTSEMRNIKATGEDRGRYVHVVGNGTQLSQRSNAHTLDWNGNAWYAGDVTATNADGNSVSLINHAHSWNDLEDKPFYENLTETEIVNGTYETNYADRAEKYMIVIEGVPTTDKINSNNHMNVIYDGSLYSNLPIITVKTNGLKMDAWGNLSLVSEDELTLLGFGNSEDTGEPFVFISMRYSDTNTVITGYANDTEVKSHDISISVVEDTSKQLDPKFVNAYTKEEIDAMFASLINGEEVEF